MLPRYEIRRQFAHAMSAMYEAEVPLYKDLLEEVKLVNKQVLQSQPQLLTQVGSLERVTEERHGAIRVGTEEELRWLARMFNVMGMVPVNYYDLTTEKLPVHSTAFRPVDDEGLTKSPFRIFCSLLQIDNRQFFTEDQSKRIRDTLNKRSIVTPNAVRLIEMAEQQDGLNPSQAEQFVKEAIETFRWHTQAQVSEHFYQELLNVSRLAADIVGFKGPHINHLTPRVLDIDLLYANMVERKNPDGTSKFKMKDSIEGPPHRAVDILLRQTSFLALEEVIAFKDQHGIWKEGKHTARFGEIEQRGIALTPKGFALYQQLLAEFKTQMKDQPKTHHQTILQKVFSAFPDDIETLRAEDLAYFTYAPDGHGGKVATPITYEDFLPASAAGIFRSNLHGQEGTMQHSPVENPYTKETLEKALGRAILDPFQIYATLQQHSLEQVEKIS